MINFAATFDIDTLSLLGFLLYWVPVAICAVGYTLRTWKNYQKDLGNLYKKEHYSPTDTVGDVFGRVAATLCPVINLFAVVFDLGPKALRNFFKYFSNVLDRPLVPRRK